VVLPGVVVVLSVAHEAEGAVVALLPGRVIHVESPLLTPKWICFSENRRKASFVTHFIRLSCVAHRLIDQTAAGLLYLLKTPIYWF
jgi:hypothetical protein